MMDRSKEYIDKKKARDVAGALLWASDKGYSSVVSILLDNGADVNSIATWRATALMLSARTGCFDTVKTLLTANANVNSVSDNGWTALIIASDKGHSEVVSLLLEYGADVNAKGIGDKTPLMYAVDNYLGNGIIVGDLLSKGADVNAQNNEGETALILAVQKGNMKIIRILLSHVDIDASIKDRHGFSALDWELRRFKGTKISKLSKKICKLLCKKRQR